MIIVDTTVWIDYLRGRDNRETDYLDRELSRQRLGLTDRKRLSWPPGTSAGSANTDEQSARPLTA
jgi:hypothetical protein